MRRAILLAAVTLLALGAPAEAALSVCNKTSLPARVALGRFDGSRWISEGWWTVRPRTCAGLITGQLDSRYYYLYATDGAAGIWDGKTHFCVAPEAKFKAPRGGCTSRSMDRRGFFQVDTGQAGD